jgi:phosphopantothenoylcysteine decarboxylase / phosphopantothenate---cysteine ligase
MGYAIADAFAQMGAEVILVSGPTSLEPETSGVKRIDVISAEEMYRACAEVIEGVDIAVFSAAVADFTPEKKVDKKMKSSKDNLLLQLIPTKDIAAELGKLKRKDQVFVGFALETEKGIEYATGKLQKKNFDLIVLNTLEDEGAGFGTNTNKVTMIDKSGNIDKFELKLKSEVASDVVDKTLKLLKHA